MIVPWEMRVRPNTLDPSRLCTQTSLFIVIFVQVDNLHKILSERSYVTKSCNGVAGLYKQARAALYVRCVQSAGAIPFERVTASLIVMSSASLPA